MTENPAAAEQERLDAAQERIDDAKSAEADLRERGILADAADECGNGVERRAEPPSVEEFDGPGPNPA